jgi:hypothetical protein
MGGDCVLRQGPISSAPEQPALNLQLDHQKSCCSTNGDLKRTIESSVHNRYSKW